MIVKQILKLIRSLLVICYDIKLSLDSILLLCGHYLRADIKVGVIRDTIDDLLEIRTVLSQDEDRLKELLKDIEN
jgi:hypothetical protein